MKINIVVTDFVNDVMYSRKSVNARVVITLLLHDVIHWKTATSYVKSIFISVNTIAVAKPEKAQMVESMLIQMAQTGQIQGKVHFNLVIACLTFMWFPI